MIIRRADPGAVIIGVRHPWMASLLARLRSGGYRVLNGIDLLLFSPWGENVQATKSVGVTCAAPRN
jgi:hypothetical protein